MHSQSGFESRPLVGPGRSINPLASLRAHKLLILAIFFLIVLLGTPVAWIKGEAVYYTEGVVQVSPRFLRNLQDDIELEFQSNSQYRQYVQQQVMTINRYDVVSKALDSLGEDRHLWQNDGESPRRAAERLQGALSVRPVPDTYLIAVGLSGSKPEGMERIVNAVIETYLAISKTEEFYGKDERIEALRNERSGLAARFPLLRDRKTEIAQSLGVTTFSASFLNPYDQLLIGAKEAFSAAKRRRITAESEFFAWDVTRNPQAAAALTANAEQIVGADPGLNSFKSNLNMRRTELLRQGSGLTPEHNGRKAIERELGEIDQEMRRATKQRVDAVASMLLEQRRSVYLEAKRIEDSLAQEVRLQERLAAEFAAQYQEALELDLELDKVRNEINRIDDRIDFLQFESNAPGFVRMVTAARPPEIPIQGGKKKLLVMVLVAAFGCALAAPVAIDFIDPRIRVPADVEKVVGEPLLGWVEEKVDPQAAARATEQTRRIAGALERESKQQGSRLFAFTAVTVNSGTTELTLDVAHGLTQLNLRPLVVEVNMSRPDPVYENGRQTLKDCLDTGASLLEAVVPAQGLLCDRLSAGAVDHSERLELTRRLRDRLQELVGHYDMVLLDTAPLIGAAEIELLLDKADVTLLCVRTGLLSRAGIRRTASKLEKLGSSVVAFVLNRVNPVDVA
ncbi:MAG: hypothetical protein JSU96_11180 [Acidobacteriota bacterium]|nr:MAG: hypothetical protein JSU96_11180 [Acidobacteriota bacterium]